MKWLGLSPPFGVVGSLVLVLARLANASKAILGLAPAGIGFVVLMPLRALGLVHVAIATCKVLPSCNRLEVSGVDTDSVSAEMVKIKSSRDFANEKFVSKAMYQELGAPSTSNARTYGNLAVPMVTNMASPSPTCPWRSLLDFRPQTFLQGLWGWTLGSQPLLPVFQMRHGQYLQVDSWNLVYHMKGV